MDKEMLNIVNDLSKKPTAELALQIMELAGENLILEQENKKCKEAIDKAITNINILIEIIKQQPTDNTLDDLWILDKLNGFKNILKGVE